MGLVGTGLLAVGVFTPLVRLPIVGTINYFSNGSGDGTVILIIAGIAVVLASTRRPTWLLPCGVTSMGLLGILWLSIRDRLSSAKASLASDLDDNPFRGLAEAMSQSVQIEWGWAVMVAGAGLLLVAAVSDRERPSKTVLATTGGMVAVLLAYAYYALLVVPAMG